MSIKVNSRGQATKIPTQRVRPTKVKINARGKMWAKIIGIFLLFLLGVHIGTTEGVKTGQNSIPANVMAQLDWCNAHSKTPCHAEYMTHTPLTPGAAASKNDKGPAGWDVIGDNDQTVSDFNDGFATSKQDDCQQGAKVACDWLKTAQK